jgi:hypothetical protein
MAFTTGVALNAQVGGLNFPGSLQKVYTGDAKFDETISGSASNIQVNFTITVATLEALLITSDKEVVMETNNATTPDQTFTIPAGGALLWVKNMLTVANPITIDVTKLFFTNNSTEPARIQAQKLEDATP